MELWKTGARAALPVYLVFQPVVHPFDFAQGRLHSSNNDASTSLRAGTSLPRSVGHPRSGPCTLVRPSTRESKRVVRGAVDYPDKQRRPFDYAQGRHSLRDVWGILSVASRLFGPTVVALYRCTFVFGGFLETCRVRSTDRCFHVLGVCSAAHHSPKAGEYGGRGIVGWAGSQSGSGAGGASHGRRQCRAHRGGDL